MLPGLSPAVGTEALSAQWLEAIGGSGTGSVITFSGLDVPKAGLLCFAPVGPIGGGPTVLRTINSMTLDGNSIPIYGANPSTNVPVRWGVVPVVAGTYTVTITYSSSTGYSPFLGAWLLRGVRSIVPFFTQRAELRNLTIPISMTYPEGHSISLFSHYHWTTGDTTWTNATEDFESFVAGGTNNQWSRAYASKVRKSVAGNEITSITRAGSLGEGPDVLAGIVFR